MEYFSVLEWHFYGWKFYIIELFLKLLHENELDILQKKRVIFTKPIVLFVAFGNYFPVYGKLVFRRIEAYI